MIASPREFAARIKPSEKAQNKEKRALCISGGGAWGGYAVGMLKAWNRDYDLITGVSTGSLIAPFAALKNWEKLEKGYTNVGLKDVFNVSPFNNKGKIKWWMIPLRIAQVKLSIGEMYPLRQSLIPAFYPKEDHAKIRQLGKEVFVTTSSIGLNYPATEYFSTSTYEYNDFCDAMFGSCCFWPVSNIAMIQGKEHVDGGWTKSLAIELIREMGYKNIDVIILRPKKVVREEEKGYFRNMFKVGYKILAASRFSAQFDDLEHSCRLAALDPETNINVYYTPKVLSKNAMYFNKAEMQSWVKLGEEMAFNPEICESF